MIYSVFTYIKYILFYIPYEKKNFSSDTHCKQDMQNGFNNNDTPMPDTGGTHVTK